MSVSIFQRLPSHVLAFHSEPLLEWGLRPGALGIPGIRGFRKEEQKKKLKKTIYYSPPPWIEKPNAVSIHSGAPDNKLRRATAFLYCRHYGMNYFF